MSNILTIYLSRIQPEDRPHAIKDEILAVQPDPVWTNNSVLGHTLAFRVVPPDTVWTIIVYLFTGSIS